MVSAMVENETLRTVISGTAGGIASILAVHPLDTVRTRLQAAPAGAYRGAWHCARVTVRREGPLALYKGLAWPLAAQGLYKAVMFGVYGAASRALRGGDPARPLAAHEVFAPAASPAAPTPWCWRPSSWSGTASRSRRGGRRLRAAPRRAEIKQELAQGRTFECHAGPARGGGGGRRLPRPRGHAATGRAGRRRAYYAALEAMRRARGGARGSPKLELAAVHQSNCRGDESTRRPD